jgi:hypothetical protein
LDHVIAARAAAGESDADAKERYAAYARLALCTGDGDGGHLTRPQIVRLSPRHESGADWESYYVTLAFDVRSNSAP